ncbi:dihydroneopterin aldolase [Candidatus Vecturithrix granuli]|uniref:7,8-dihydroneopterin aldolase n=1 Tax=Vecturithrix granuli TaxID=1499967 RepID=A0A081C5N1_VECG1|nr:dihydroneopterin aldolase [Candidatus Vecturithrix granuli]
MEHKHDRLDRIHIRDLFLRGIVGINPEERTKQQDILINITLFADLSAAGQSDRIEDAVNYKDVKNRVVEMVERSSYFLLERLAERVAEICLEEPAVQHVQVLVEKPGALRFARSVGVEIFRSRE